MEFQHISPSGSSHFRTIVRQNSFELDLEPVISCGRLGSVTVIRPQPRTPSQDPDSCTVLNTPLAEEKNLYIDHSTPSDLSETNVDSAHTHQSTFNAQENRDSSFYSTSLTNGTDNSDSKNNTVGVVAHVSTVIENVSKNSVTEPGDEQHIQQREDCTVTATSPSSTESTKLKQQGASSEQSEQGSTSSNPVSEGDSGIDPCAEGAEEGSRSGVVDGSDRDSLTKNSDSKVELRAAGASWTATPEVLVNSSEASSKMEHQKKKGKALLYAFIMLLFHLTCSRLIFFFVCRSVAARRNHHLGPTDIYLDDLTTLDPEMAALYFPKR